MNSSTVERRTGRAAHWEWVVPAVVLGVLILLTMPEFRIASGQDKVFVLSRSVNGDCEKLSPFIGVRTDQFEVLGRSWVEGRDAYGLCMIDVKLAGYGPAHYESASSFYRFLRDAVGIPEATLQKSFIGNRK